MWWSQYNWRFLLTRTTRREQRIEKYVFQKTFFHQLKEPTGTGTFANQSDRIKKKFPLNHNYTLLLWLSAKFFLLILSDWLANVPVPVGSFNSWFTIGTLCKQQPNYLASINYPALILAHNCISLYGCIVDANEVLNTTGCIHWDTVKHYIYFCCISVSRFWNVKIWFHHQPQDGA